MGTIVSERWSKSTALAFLSQKGWFASLSAAMQETIVNAGEIVDLKANTALYKTGDPVTGLYAALTGDVRAYAFGDEGERIFLRPLGPGSWFGDVHLLDSLPYRTFETVAISPSTLFFLPTESHRKLTEDIACYKAFVGLMCVHARNAVRVLVETRSEAPRRAARALIRLARAHGVPADGATRLQMNLSQADLASLVGVSRQYMNELIARWEDEGFLRWNGKSHPQLFMDRLRTLLSPQDSWIENTDDWL